MDYFKFTRSQQIALVVLVGLALVAVAVGKIRSSRSAPLTSSGVDVSEASDSGVRVEAPGGEGSRDSMPQLVVDVKGSVNKPGVYSLKPGSRVNDAIKVAGGASSGADLNAVNLAARLKDGEQVVVPNMQQTMPPMAGQQASVPTYSAPSSAYSVPPTHASTSAYAPRPAASGSGANTSGPSVVNINTGGPADLDRLPGVGPATAQKILEYRSRIGRFSSVDQLLEVKGIGPKKLEEMRPFVAL